MVHCDLFAKDIELINAKNKTNSKSLNSNTTLAVKRKFGVKLAEMEGSYNSNSIQQQWCQQQAQQQTHQHASIECDFDQ